MHSNKIWITNNKTICLLCNLLQTIIQTITKFIPHRWLMNNQQGCFLTTMFCGCEAMRWSWESSRLPLWRTLPAWTSSSSRVRRWADIPRTSCRWEPGPPIRLVNRAVQKSLEPPDRLPLRKSSKTLTSCWGRTDYDKLALTLNTVPVCYKNCRTRHRAMEIQCNCNHLLHSLQRLHSEVYQSRLWWKKNVTQTEHI